MKVKLCECGCGLPAPIAKQTVNSLGYRRGEPKRFVAGHQTRVQFAPPEERFWANVQKSEGCWMWLGACDEDGYGSIYVHGKIEKAHRYSYQIHRGPIPDGKWVLHDCDMPGCVRPDHIYAGTLLDNIRDCVNRNRTSKGDRNGSRLYPERRPRGTEHWTHKVEVMPTRGEHNAKAKLTPTQVAEIRMLYAAGQLSQKKIGVIFDVTQSTVGSIVNNHSWKHVKESE